MLSSIVIAAAVSVGSAASPLMPCKVGASLTYQGRVEWTGEPPIPSRSKNLVWHSRFVECRQKGAVHVAVMKGMPFDLAWYEPHKKPAFYVVIENAEGLFIETSDDLDAAKGAANLSLDGERLGEQLLRFPLRRGDCIGEDGENTSDPGCQALYRLVQNSKGTEIWLSSSTLPDDERIVIISGIGISRYEYHHHGTVSSAKVSLIHTTIKTKPGTGRDHSSRTSPGIRD